MSNLSPEAYLRPEIIRQIQRFDLKAKFIMEGFLAGLHSSPYKGFSVEFSEHRKYVAGDDIRTIDWQVWSRTNRYYVKQYEAETNLNGHIIVDVSASMGYAGKKGGITKLEYATCLAGALAYLIIHQQDPVGLITFDHEIRDYIKAKCKASHLLSILRTLSTIKPQERTGLASCIHQVAEMIPHRGLVVLISDLLSDEEELINAFLHLRYRGHDVVVFHVLDEAEATFPFEQLTCFQDVEGIDVSVTTDPRSIRTQYLEELNSFVEFLRKECAKKKIDFVSIDTSMSFDKALLAYLGRRCGK